MTLGVLYTAKVMITTAGHGTGRCQLWSGNCAEPGAPLAPAAPAEPAGPENPAFLPFRSAPAWSRAVQAALAAHPARAAAAWPAAAPGQARPWTQLSTPPVRHVTRAEDHPPYRAFWRTHHSDHAPMVSSRAPARNQ